MTTFSRKKIRGFDRKLKQLDNWKNSILSFPADKLGTTPAQIFRIHLNPFIWYGDKNPHIKFHKYLYQTYSDIFSKLKDHETVKNNKLTVQLWLFYPQTIRSLVIVAPEDQRVKRNAKINATETKLLPPKIIGSVFSNQKWKIGDDKVFELVSTNDENSKWVTHRRGDIWVVE